MLQNWPIRSKLVVILVVPLAALAVLSVIQVRGNVDNVRAANRIKALATFSIKANDLVAALQVERYSTNSYVGSNYLVPPLGQAAVAARAPVDQALAVYRAGEAGLPPGARNPLATTLAAISGRLDKLPAQRRAIDAQQARVDQNITYFNDMVNDLLSLNARVAAGSQSARLVNGATTLAGVAEAKEEAAQQRGAIARVIILGQTDPLTVRQIQSSAGAEDAWLVQFRSTATPEQLAFYDVTVGRTISAATAMRDGTVNAVVSSQPITTTQAAWLQTVDAKIEAMREVERRIATDLGSTSASISRSATREALVSGFGVTLVLIVSIMISLLVASPMIRHLRRLRQGALEVANDRLPSVVERLHRGEQVDMTAEVFPVDVQSTDEIGQLADAFSTVHAVAVRTAVEQAAMRKSIGDTFLNLARRSQALIHRQLKIIDGLERKETDPDELEELFRLDHLATRMRRHAEDLIVLSGSKPARGWRRPVAIKDVVRGAVAEVEDYTRVKVMPIDGGAISGHAVGDVIHMLAELIENATSFSPPHTPVQVSGHEVSNGFVIEVEDRGLGMSPEEFGAINERLAEPPPFDLSTSERLGLFVVGRLAQRHAVSVRLRPSPYGGTMAIVLVPGTLLRQPEDDLDTRGTGIGATVRSLPAPAVPALDGPDFDEDGLAERRRDEPHRDDRRFGSQRSADRRREERRLDLARPADPPGEGRTEDPPVTRGLRPADSGPAEPVQAGTGPVGFRPAGAEPTGPAPIEAAPAGSGLPDRSGPAGSGSGPAAEEPAAGWPGHELSPVEGRPADAGRTAPGAAGAGSAGSPNAAVPPADPASGQDETLLDDLPVFATVRSNWFVADRARERGEHGVGAAYREDGAADDRDDENATVDELSVRRGDRGPREADRDRRAGRSPESRDVELPELPHRRAARTGPVRMDQASGLVHADDRRAATPAEASSRHSRREHGGAPPGAGESGSGEPDSLFGPIPAALDQGARSSRPGEVARLDPLTSPLSRPTGPRSSTSRHTDSPAASTPSGLGEAGEARRPATPPRGREARPAGPGARSAEGQTDIGLPRRTRRASLAPQLRREAESDKVAPLSAQRSPEEIRSMMSSFQSNFGRGLADGQDSNDGDDAGKVT